MMKLQGLAKIGKLVLKVLCAGILLGDLFYVVYDPMVPTDPFPQLQGHFVDEVVFPEEKNLEGQGSLLDVTSVNPAVDVKGYPTKRDLLSFQSWMERSGLFAIGLLTGKEYFPSEGKF